jgi:hypothetical protein
MGERGSLMSWSRICEGLDIGVEERVEETEMSRLASRLDVNKEQKNGRVFDG